jgi:hypothetical protein
MTKDEALKLALEALDSQYILGCGEWRGQQLKAITAIREALAQPAPVQEPDIYPEEARELGLEAVAYYTTPPAAQPAQEPIYQMQMMDGRWIDQAKQSYESYKAHGHTMRIVYITPPTPPAPKENT